MDERNEATDEALEHCQSPALYPLGRALRSTYHADNHETLSADVTALMITLSRIDYEPCEKPLVVASAVGREPAAASSLLSRVVSLWGR